MGTSETNNVSGLTIQYGTVMQSPQTPYALESNQKWMFKGDLGNMWWPKEHSVIGLDAGHQNLGMKSDILCIDPVRAHEIHKPRPGLIA